MDPMKNNPCFGCKPPKRTPTCHATCADWIIAKAFHEALKEERLQTKLVDQYSIDTARKNREHSMRRRQSFKGHHWRNS